MSEASQETPVEPKKEKKIWGPAAGLGYGLLIFIGAQVFAAIVIGILAGINGQEITEYYDQNTILVSFIGSVLLGGLTISLVYLATKKYGGFKALKLNKFKLKDNLLILPAYVVYVIISAILFFAASTWIPSIDLDQEQVIGFEAATDNLQLILAFLSLVVIAPISEEILFRGYTYQGLRRSFSWLGAAVLSGALFGLAHFQLNVALDTFALGLVAAWLLERTGSLWPAILLHGLKNSIAFIILFVIG